MGLYYINNKKNSSKNRIIEKKALYLRDLKIGIINHK